MYHNFIAPKRAFLTKHWQRNFGSLLQYCCKLAAHFLSPKSLIYASISYAASLCRLGTRKIIAGKISRSRSRALAACIVLILLAGCKLAPKVAVYEVPKDTTVRALLPKPNAHQSSAMPILPGMVEAAAGMDRPTWKVPVGWLAEPLDNLRQGSWKVEGPQSSYAEISVLAFPGDVGGDLANVNRWRSQIGLSEWDETAYLAHSKKIEVDGSQCTWVVLQDPNSPTKEAIAAVIMPKGLNTWFFKLKGDRAAVEAELQSFQDFVLTVNFNY